MTDCKQLGPRFVGDPVDATTGEVRDIATDFRLEGPRGLVWNRCYRSTRTAQRGLGLGHRHVLDWTLHRDVDGYRVDTPLDSIFFHAGSTRGWTLTRASDDVFQLTRDGAPMREFARDPAGGRVFRLRRVVHPDGGETVLQYRGARDVELVSVRDTEGWTLTLTWADKLLRSIGVTAPFGTFTPIQYTYDDGRLAGGRDAYGHAFAWSYDDAARVTRRVDRRGYAFVYTYDDRGRCVRVAGEDDLDAVTLEFLPNRRETRVVHEGNGATWWYRYDARGELLEIADPYGGHRSLDAAESTRAARVVVDNTAQQEHGARAGLGFDVLPAAMLRQRLPTAVAEALVAAEYAGVVRAIRDAQGRLLQEDRTFPGSGFTQSRTFAYDPNGNLLEASDFDGAATRHAYASWNQRILTRDAVGGETHLAHDSRDRLCSVRDPGGTETTYRWDLCDRLFEVHRHGALRERYLYDGAGGLVEKQGPGDRTLVTYERGRDGGLLGRETWDGRRERFRRDAQGRISSATSRDNLTDPIALQRSYDAAGQLVREARDGLGFDHTHDDAGRRRTVFAGRFAVEYRRGADGTTCVVDPVGGEHTIRSLGAGLWQRDFASGSWEVSQYDGAGRCLARVSNGSSGAWRRRFARTGEGDVVSRDDDRRGRTEYAYDALHRLTEVRHPGGRVDPYEHDAAGNVLHKPGLREWVPILEGPPDLRDERRLSTTTGNRIWRANSDRFHYDEHNHVSGRSGEWGEYVFVHDGLGRLKKVFYKSGLTAKIKLRWEAEYDALGRRALKRRYRKGGRPEEWNFYWDGDRLGAEVLPEGAVRIYLYPDEVALVPMLAVEYDNLDADAGSGRVFVLQTDHRGAIERVEDERGAIVWEAIVHPYGETELLEGHAFHQPFRLVGQYEDPGLNLVYSRFRYWSAELARFVESDPLGLGGGLNVYAWPGCPLRDSDPLGLACTAAPIDPPIVPEEGVDAEKVP